jgi:hypothetical protein
MSNLGFVARAAASAPSPFNGDFYLAVATVIPVLYVALAVQGDAYEPFVRAAFKFKPGDQRPHILRRIVAGIIAAAIIVDGVIGEGLALYILYKGNAGAVGRGTGLTLLILTIFFVISAATGPALKVIKIVNDLIDDINSLPAEQEPVPSQDETGRTHIES